MVIIESKMKFEHNFDSVSRCIKNWINTDNLKIISFCVFPNDIQLKKNRTIVVARWKATFWALMATQLALPLFKFHRRVLQSVQLLVNENFLRHFELNNQPLYD